MQSEADLLKKQYDLNAVDVSSMDAFKGLKGRRLFHTSCICILRVDFFKSCFTECLEKTCRWSIQVLHYGTGSMLQY